MKIKIEQAVIVEGVYDKIKLDSIIDATVICTHGFAIFSDKPKLELIRKLAQKCGIVILTDSDSAGFKIRTYLKQCIDNSLIKHAYIPDVFGKERRKAHAGKEGLVGVEGIDVAKIVRAFEIAGCTIADNSQDEPKKELITKSMLCADGLAGGENSATLRAKLADAAGLPAKISANAMLAALNKLYTVLEYRQMLDKL